MRPSRASFPWTPTAGRSRWTCASTPPCPRSWSTSRSSSIAWPCAGALPSSSTANSASSSTGPSFCDSPSVAVPSVKVGQMKAPRRFVTSVVLVFLIVAGLLGTILVTGMKPKLGLDLQGGLSVVLTAPNGTPSDKINEAVNILRNRIDRAGVGEPAISREGSNNILIEIPGVKDSAALLKLVGQTAELQFRPVTQILSPSDPGYATATVAASADAKDQQLTLGGTNSADKNKYVVGPVAVEGSGVSGATAVVDPSSGAWSVSLSFKSDASKVWAAFTGKLACNPVGSPSRQIAIVLDNVVQSAPALDQKIQCNAGIGT